MLMKDETFAVFLSQDLRIYNSKNEVGTNNNCSVERPCMLLTLVEAELRTVLSNFV